MRRSIGPEGQLADTCAGILRRDGITAPTPSAEAADRHPLHRQFQRGAGPYGFDLVGACLEVLAGDGPAVTPQQRTDVQHADAAAVEIGLVMARELLHAIAEIEQPKCPGPM